MLLTVQEAEDAAAHSMELFVDELVCRVVNRETRLARSAGKFPLALLFSEEEVEDRLLAAADAAVESLLKLLLLPMRFFMEQLVERKR